jgi:L-methionine (R)-S-oxide reductase
MPHWIDPLRIDGHSPLMFDQDVPEDLSVAERYAQLRLAVRGVTADEPDLIANLANVAAILGQGLPRINWVGFYLLKQGELVVGPFQGKPACVRIPLGGGVCGTAAAERRSIVVRDVDAFPGHIPCDAASKSEVVVPIVIDDELVAVLDVDSPEFDRFDDADRAGLEGVVEELAAAISASR